MRTRWEGLHWVRVAAHGADKSVGLLNISRFWAELRTLGILGGLGLLVHNLRVHSSILRAGTRNIKRLDGILRVRPKSSRGFAKPSEHQSNGCQAKERQRGPIEVLEIFRQPPATSEPAKAAFDDPTLW